jgi:hypothetical protein
MSLTKLAQRRVEFQPIDEYMYMGTWLHVLYLAELAQRRTEFQSIDE